ncbi:pentapeptide repeat-containing protein [Fortiea contorta]|uniref:pentapeptide repeat-containing protein n=1 Tax=Fortiea contorta TaxID=1892405 RepID=UPI0003478B45|nr:pentapeptide repeat-containing protein [Fortiea contorta]
MNNYHITKNLLTKSKIYLKSLFSQANSVETKINLTHKQPPTQYLKIAITNLQNRHIETNLATIDNLEQIAQKYPQLHWEITVILTNFVRRSTPYLPQTENKPHPSPTVCEDIQAALSVIARRNAKQDPENEQLDLSYTDMTDVILCGASLEKANLYQANLAGVDLTGANLRGAILTAANLQGANLKGANLEQAILSAANLENANLTGANFHRANLYLAKLHQATLNHAILTQANLKEAVFFDESS